MLPEYYYHDDTFILGEFLKTTIELARQTRLKSVQLVVNGVVTTWRDILEGKVCVVGILFRFRLGIPPKFTLCHPDQQGILDKWWQLCLVLKMKGVFLCFLVSCMWRMDWIGIQIAWSTLPKSVVDVFNITISPHTPSLKTHTSRKTIQAKRYIHFWSLLISFSPTTRIFEYIHTQGPKLCGIQEPFSFTNHHSRHVIHIHVLETRYFIYWI